MGCRRRSAHRGPRAFLTGTAAETGADVHTLSHHVRRAIQEAEILGLSDVADRLGEAMSGIDSHAARLPGTPDRAREVESLGQHETEEVV